MIPYDQMSAFFASFTLIGLAEVGDKSQIVCMALAARHKHWPVLTGAVVAFLILNTLAVVFGASIAEWLPERVIAGVVAVLFAVFGVHALLLNGDNDVEEVPESGGRSVFMITLSLIFLAELGDKTQIAVAGLASTMTALPVWLGATAALIMVSSFGIWIGATLLRHLPISWLHRIGGVIFIVFAMIAAWKFISL